MHSVTLHKTTTDWHYAKCSCGWRSLGYPPAKREAAEHSGEAHKKEEARR